MPVSIHNGPIITKNILASKIFLFFYVFIIWNSLLRIVLLDGCTIGAFSVIPPGTIVEQGVNLGMGSYTNITQRLEKNFIYYSASAKSQGKTDNSFIYTKNYLLFKLLHINNNKSIGEN